MAASAKPGELPGEREVASGHGGHSPDFLGEGDLMIVPSQATKARTAFLALDFATYIVENFSHDGAVVERASDAMASARAAGLPVFHVVHEAMRDQIHPLLAPVGDESVLAKTTMGAFATTNLHERLQASGVGRVVIAGVATSGWRRRGRCCPPPGGRTTSATRSPSAPTPVTTPTRRCIPRCSTSPSSRTVGSGSGALPAW